MPGVHGVGQRADLDVAAHEPAQAGGQRRDADVPVAGVGDHDDVGAQVVAVLVRGEPARVSEPTSSSPSTKNGHVDRQVVAEDPQRGQVRRDAGLVVGRAAAVEAVAALGRLEGRRVPVGVVVLRLHVVVGVEQHGRRARRARACARPRPGRRPRRWRSSPSNPSASNRRGTASALRRTSPARSGSALTDSMRTRSSRSRRTPGRTSATRARSSSIVGVVAMPASPSDRSRLPHQDCQTIIRTIGGSAVSDDVRHDEHHRRAAAAPPTAAASRHGPHRAHRDGTPRTTTTRCRWCWPTGKGAWVTDVDGKRYLDCLAGYSALNFGHGHPRLLARAHEQLDRLTLTSRAFYNDQLGPFARDLAELTGKDMILPMNSGAEAVETAIKVSRRWGYQVKGVPEAQATIVVMEGNFHGRTTTIVSFSNDSDATVGYAPYTPGFRMVPYGDIAALAAADRRDDGGRAARADPGRGRRDHPAGGLPARGARAVHRDQRADGGRRDPVRPGPHRHAPSRATTRTSSPTSTSSARRSAAGSTPSPRSRPTTTCST